MSFTHLDLFSGIGGFALAVRWLGGETVGFVEYDPWCRKVLAKNFPGVKQLGDVKEVRGDEFGAVDLVTGGYPCQPFSVAGQRRGAEDDRHLWPHMRRIIDTARPRFVLAENVAGHISMGLDTVFAEMEADGYTAGAVVVPACAVNALHRRDRIWIMAHSSDNRPQAELQPRSTEPQHATTGHGGSSSLMADTWGGRSPEPRLRGDASDSAPGRDGQATEPVHGCPAEKGRKASRTLDVGPDGLPPRLVRHAWRDGSWEHGLPRVVAHEESRKHKLQAAGNAIVPQVAYEILRVMLGETA